MTLLAHLSARKSRAKKRNPKAIIDLTVEDAEQIIVDFMEMRFQRDEALRILKMRTIPNAMVFLPHGKTQ